MEGYWNKPEVNARSFSDGWFRTGDIFTKIKGGHFRYVGRFKDMIKRSGENISAVEVETMIRQFSAIEEVAVIPVKHKVRGEGVKTFIAPHRLTTPRCMPTAPNVSPRSKSPVTLRLSKLLITRHLPRSRKTA